jgi:hypothetical protein
MSPAPDPGPDRLRQTRPDLGPGRGVRADRGLDRSATTQRDRRDEGIAAGAFEQLEQLCLEAYDRIVGLQLPT